MNRKTNERVITDQNNEGESKTRVINNQLSTSMHLQKFLCTTVHYTMQKFETLDPKKYLPKKRLEKPTTMLINIGDLFKTSYTSRAIV